jgi:integrase
VTPRPRKPWSKMIRVAGISVRLYEREAGGMLHREFWHPDGRRDRKSLGHADRQTGEQQMRLLARRVAELRLTGVSDVLTLGQLVRLYTAHRAPNLSPARRKVAEMCAPYFLAHLGDSYELENLGQTQIDSYVIARRSRLVKSPRHRGPTSAPRDGTIRNEINWLKAAAKWARSYKVNGRRLLTTDPFEGLSLPSERNPRRPVASEDRFQRTAAVADTVDPSGRLACMLQLARYTGRRVNAICQLTAADVFLTRDQASRALAAAGMDEGQADHMPHGAIRWREMHDKLGYLELTAISAPARAALERYLKLQPRLGSVPLFPSRVHVDRPLTKIDADYLLRTAEKAAGVPKFDRGLWHPYRRAWASSRKHLPDVDVSKAGGWRDLATMKAAYQQADPATMLKAIENEPDRHTTVTGVQRSADGSTT